MNILMVTSETVPFSKSGGLADVVGALSQALADRDNNVSILMPMYGFIDNKKFRSKGSITVSVFGKEEKAEVLATKVGSVTYYAIKHPLYTDRKGIYGDTSFTPYEDNSYRYLLFSLFTLPFIKEVGLNVDIIHCHDWTTGFIPALVKRSKFNAKVIFTIHNLAYQGEFSRFDILRTLIKPSGDMFRGEGLEKRLNFLSTGLEYADMITTVSPSYAKEIQTKEQGCSLEQILARRKDILYGIINGIDYKEWNSAKDKFFSEHYSATNLSPKAELKKAVQAEYGLEVNPSIPLIAMISRIASQKGFEALLFGEKPVLENILQDNKCQLILIGTGDKRYEEKLLLLGKKYKNLSVNIIFSQEASHRVEGAADFFLMPSIYEPCGLNQLYSLHYGTLPIAHKTGGLADTIVDIEQDKSNGTGFLFESMDQEEIIKTIENATNFYRENPEEYKKAQKRGMKVDFSWGRSAEKYDMLYKQLSGGAK